eukprot:scaffold618_cov130-Cylindrotheca_fusiformis.AAC.29
MSVQYKKGNSDGPSVEYLCVLDFEATCNDKHPKPNPQEIIEFPVVLLNTKAGNVEDVFHYYVRPDLHPNLSEFCTKLTGIKQEQVNAGISLFECLKLHEQWLQKHNLVNYESGTPDTDQKHFLFVTCGDWDLKTCLPNQLGHHNVKVPSFFRSWVNIKKAYSKLYNRKANGMTSMLEDLGLDLQGRHHSGIDDSKNIARICVRMISDGWVPKATTCRGTRFQSSEQPQKKKAREAPSPKGVPREVDETQCKTVYLIRHGQSQGQVAKKQNRDRKKDPKLLDCGLTSLGRQQAKDISKLMQGVPIDLVVSSPLTRALNTAILGFPNRDILVHYELREVGSRIPENTPRSMKKVMQDLHSDLGTGVDIDIGSLQPANWPNALPSNVSKHDRLRAAFEWLYDARAEKNIAVVCHFNVIRSLIQDGLGRTDIRPQNGVPIKCLLTPEGSLIVTNPEDDIK